MTKKRTKALNPLIYVVIALSIISTAFVGYNVVAIIGKTSVATQGKDTNKLENKFYTIGNNATDYQKEVFNEMTAKLNDETVDDLAIVDLVAKSFISDLFTWTNKDGNYEVGGQQYVYGSAVPGFNTFMRDTYYSQLDAYIAQYGRDYLPEVSNIESEAFLTGEFETYFGKYPGYYVYLKWDYKKHEKSADATSKIVDTSEFPTELNLYLIKTEEGRFEVVQFLDKFD